MNDERDEQTKSFSIH